MKYLRDGYGRFLKGTPGHYLRKRIERTCLCCGKKFEETIYRVKDGRGKFCSKKCQYKTGWSQDSREKMSLKLKDQWNKGIRKRILSVEDRRKKSISHKKRVENGECHLYKGGDHDN